MSLMWVKVLFLSCGKGTSEECEVILKMTFQPLRWDSLSLPSAGTTVAMVHAAVPGFLPWMLEIQNQVLILHRRHFAD